MATKCKTKMRCQGRIEYRSPNGISITFIFTVNIGHLQIRSIKKKKKRNNTNNMHAQLYSTNRIPIDFALHILPLAHFESETKSISAKKQLEPKYRKIRPYRCSFRFVATKNSNTSRHTEKIFRFTNHMI